ncbi:ATP/GTP-binding protein [Streptomyces pathocidini]|uniref:GTP-binding protein n=1 Tax=Streptomyces pathocidini TaxID=1650571 RepID=A0ABW7UND5_9ACTN|nr:ATP/GTP-binding protein [Streptomyces pathocidini]
MDCENSEETAHPQSDGIPKSAGVKIVIVGGFGVGKTTMVGSVSEIRPLRTEETMTQAGVGIDDPAGVEQKTTTTVVLDFGRITVSREMVLYLFGAPGQERFWFLWKGLIEGALGAVVLVDTRRLEVSFDVMNRLEEQEVPFVVAINHFQDSPRHAIEDIRESLDLPESIPIVECDVRSRESSRDVLLELMGYLHSLTATQEAS